MGFDTYFRLVRDNRDRIEVDRQGPSLTVFVPSFSTVEDIPISSIHYDYDSVSVPVTWSAIFAKAIIAVGYGSESNIYCSLRQYVYQAMNKNATKSQITEFTKFLAEVIYEHIRDEKPELDGSLLQMNDRYFPNLTTVVKNPVTGEEMAVAFAIIDLNDTQKWPFEEIADWLDTLDVDLYVRNKETGEKYVRSNN